MEINKRDSRPITERLGYVNQLRRCLTEIEIELKSVYPCNEDSAHVDRQINKGFELLVSLNEAHQKHKIQTP